MGFDGYPKGLQSFFKELKANNSKDWFDANRARFDDEVMGPSVALVSALSEPLAALKPSLSAVPKVNSSIRRIFRDTRFSKDKTPYHTHLHLIFWVGDHPNRSPGVHLVMADDHFGYGAGHWGFEADQLARYRENIAKDKGVGVARAVDAVTKTGVVLDDPALARIPAGFDRDARWAGWARYKGLVVKSGDLDYPKALFEPEGVDYVVDLCRAMAPLNSYLTEEVFS